MDLGLALAMRPMGSATSVATVSRLTSSGIGLPSRGDNANFTNASGHNSANIQQIVHVMVDTPNPVLVFGNFGTANRDASGVTGAGSTGLCPSPGGALTVTFSVTDRVTGATHQGKFGGSTSYTLADQEIKKADPITTLAGGKMYKLGTYDATDAAQLWQGGRYLIRIWMKYASVPVYWPCQAARQPTLGWVSGAASGAERSESGTDITDRTMGGGIANNDVAGYQIGPLLGIMGTVPATSKAVGNFGTSIESEGSGMSSIPLVGGINNGLQRAFMPNVNIGQQGLSILAGVANDQVRAARLAVLTAMNVTHVLSTQPINDWGAGQTSAQVQANHATMRGLIQAALPGCKYILMTGSPRASPATNTAVATAQKPTWDAYVRTNPYGEGYFDLAALWDAGYIASGTSNNTWNTSGVRSSVSSTASPGSGYNGPTASATPSTADTVEFPGGKVVCTNVTAGAVSGIASIINSGYLASESTSFSQPESAICTSGTGSGLTINFTYSTVSFAPASDGVHPPNPAHAVASRFLEAQAPTLFA